MSVVAIIPARGGSKGIPLKNLQPLGGVPLIAYSVEDALYARSVDRVVVSTDHDEIAAVAEGLGAEVVRRPPGISGDDSRSEDALLHALVHMGGEEPELVVFLQATSPLRAPNDIDNAVRTLRERAADSLFSACAWHGFVWRSEKGLLRSSSYDFRRRPRRQFAPEELLENGSIYVFKPWVLRKERNRLGGVIAVYVMDQLMSFQVDSNEDLMLVERLLDLRTPRQTGSDLGVCDSASSTSTEC